MPQIADRPFSRRNTLWFLLACNALILAVCLLFLSPKLANNDDFVIHGLTSGIYGVRSAATVHTNVLLAALLVWLQTLAPALNWFVILEVAALFVSFTAMSTLVWRRNPTRRGLLISLSLVLFAAPFFYTEIHNTKSTPLIAAAGLLLFFHGVDQRSKSDWICGTLLAIFAGCMRMQAFLLGFAFAGGSILFLFFQSRWSGFVPWLKKNARGLIALGFLFAGIAAFVAVDIIYANRNPEVAYYRAYNAARGGVSDFDLPAYDTYYDAYQALGLSRNDVAMIEDWSFDDPAVFDIDTLNAIAAIPRGGQTAAQRFLSGLKDIVSSNILFPAFAAATLFFIVSVLLDKPRRRNRLVFILWPFAALLICLMYMSWIGRTTHWVLSGMLGAALFSVYDGIETETSFRQPKLAFCLCAALIAFSGANGIYNAAPRLSYHPDSPYRESAFDTVASDKDHLYITDLISLPALDAMTPVFRAAPFGLFENIYFLGGWDSQSPAKNSILTRFRIEGSVWQALLERDDVFLLDTFRYHRKILYMRENYDPGARASLVGQIGGQYVFAFARDCAVYRQRDDLIIDDVSSGSSAVNPDFMTLLLRVNRKLADDSVIWFRLETETDGLTYRVRVIQTDSGTALTADIPYLDLDLTTAYQLRVLIPDSAGLVEASPPVPISIQ